MKKKQKDSFNFKSWYLEDKIKAHKIKEKEQTSPSLFAMRQKIGSDGKISITITGSVRI